MIFDHIFFWGIKLKNLENIVKKSKFIQLNHIFFEKIKQLQKYDKKCKIHNF